MSDGMNEEIKNRNVDLFRSNKTNIPEVVLARFKDDDSLINSIRDLLPNKRVLITKCTEKQMKFLKKKFSDKVERFDKISGSVIISDTASTPEIIGSVAVLSAGSSDYFVAEEASIAAEFLGLKVFRYYDCGIAGIHRVDEATKIIDENEVDAVIVVAGMEGALPSIIASRIKQPIIAVPTSIGYGTSYRGIAALLSMLNACSPGISVVNIDNGFGAAACAYKMIKWMRDKK